MDWRNNKIRILLILLFIVLLLFFPKKGIMDSEDNTDKMKQCTCYGIVLSSTLEGSGDKCLGIYTDTCRCIVGNSKYLTEKTEIPCNLTVLEAESCYNCIRNNYTDEVKTVLTHVNDRKIRDCESIKPFCEEHLDSYIIINGRMINKRSIRYTIVSIIVVFMFILFLVIFSLKVFKINRIS